MAGKRGLRREIEGEAGRVGANIHDAHSLLPPGTVAGTMHLNLIDALGEIELEAAVAAGQSRVGVPIDEDTRDRLAGEGVQDDSTHWVEGRFLAKGKDRETWRTGHRRHQKG